MVPGNWHKLSPVLSRIIMKVTQYNLIGNAKSTKFQIEIKKIRNKISSHLKTKKTIQSTSTPASINKQIGPKHPQLHPTATKTSKVDIHTQPKYIYKHYIEILISIKTCSSVTPLPLPIPLPPPPIFTPTPCIVFTLVKNTSTQTCRSLSKNPHFSIF